MLVKTKTVDLHVEDFLKSNPDVVEIIQFIKPLTCDTSESDDYDKSNFRRDNVLLTDDELQVIEDKITYWESRNPDLTYNTFYNAFDEVEDKTFWLVQNLFSDFKSFSYDCNYDASLTEAFAVLLDKIKVLDDEYKVQQSNLR